MTQKDKWLQMCNIDILDAVFYSKPGSVQKIVDVDRIYMEIDAGRLKTRSQACCSPQRSCRSGSSGTVCVHKKLKRVFYPESMTQMQLKFNHHVRETITPLK